MRTVIIGDARYAFMRDISTAMMLESFPLKVITAKNVEELVAKSQNNKDAFVIIGDSLQSEFDPTMFQDRVVYGYASNAMSIPTFQQLGISCIGHINTAKGLLETLSKENITVLGTPQRKPAQEKPTSNIDYAKSQKSSQSSMVHQQPVVQDKEFETLSENEYVTMQSVSKNSSQKSQESQELPSQQPKQIFPQSMTPEMLAMLETFAKMMNGQQSTAKEETPEVPAEQPTLSGAADIRRRHSATTTDVADKKIEDDLLLGAVEKATKTKVVSVYAAKGGVGKTSIATELATCLALTSNGRRKFRVCIVDYNIDFGDVATTLMLDEQGPNMTGWASEIRELLERGNAPEEIRFTKKHIEDYYLQHIRATGLYALAAPIMHEDSMFIKSDELEIMLDNLIEAGNFDFIICDTGNNTRDSTVIAIDKSDYVLMIATQDVTTANCNTSVLRTLRDTGFDTEKVRLVLNNIMPAHETGISVQEVEETFPYECICRIKSTRDIIRANNIGQPLVYKPNHEYTKQIQRIVHFLTEGEVAAQEPPKKKLFGGLFSRHKS